MIFLRYKDGADDFNDEAENDEEEVLEEQFEVHGFMLFYPSLGTCKIIECTIDSAEKKQELDEFEEWVSKCLYILNENMKIRDGRYSEEIQAK